MKKKILHPKVSGLPSRAQIDISPEKTVTTRVGNDHFFGNDYDDDRDDDHNREDGDHNDNRDDCGD